MKPIAILQNVSFDGPAYFTAFLRARGVPWRPFAAFKGDALPDDIRDYSGFAILGGPMSANDGLPHLARAEELVRLALAADIPVIGHCLGGQIMAKALGVAVTPSPSAEIGWHDIEAKSPAAAQRWFGGKQRFLQFQWHHEAFGLPDGAEWLASSACCPHQAFAIGDKHLAMQFHSEVDADKVAEWLGPEGLADIAAVAASPGVQSATDIAERTTVALQESQRIATALYSAWCSGLAR